MKNRASKWALRVAAAAVIALSLTAPAPGHVGGCGAPPPGVADARNFCTDRGYWECIREEFAGRMTAAERDICLQGIEPECSAFAWPFGCAPTPEDAGACIAALRQPDLSHLTKDEMRDRPECSLCPGL